MDILLNPFENLKQFPEIKVGISTRHLGSLKKNRVLQHDVLKKLAKEFGKDASRFVFMKQVHGKVVEEILSFQNQLTEGVDGLITQKTDIVLSVVTADCLPIVIYEPIKKIIGVFHAGYKGILAGIIESELQMIQKLGGDVQNVVVGIGPGIGICCYNVMETRIQEFQKRFPQFKNIYEKRDGDFFLDLKSIARQELHSLGIPLQNIEVLPYCTSTNNDLFYSYRKEGSQTYGEFATVIKRSS